MNREEYIKYRVENQFIYIVWHYYMSIRNEEITMADYKELLNLYTNHIINIYKEHFNQKITAKSVFDDILDEAINYFDVKLEIVYVIITKEEKVIRKTQSIMIL